MKLMQINGEHRVGHTKLGWRAIVMDAGKRRRDVAGAK